MRRKEELIKRMESSTDKAQGGTCYARPRFSANAHEAPKETPTETTLESPQLQRAAVRYSRSRDQTNYENHETNDKQTCSHLNRTASHYKRQVTDTDDRGSYIPSPPTPHRNTNGLQEYLEYVDRERKNDFSQSSSPTSILSMISILEKESDRALTRSGEMENRPRKASPEPAFQTPPDSPRGHIRATYSRARARMREESESHHEINKDTGPTQPTRVLQKNFTEELRGVLADLEKDEESKKHPILEREWKVRELEDEPRRERLAAQQRSPRRPSKPQLQACPKAKPRTSYHIKHLSMFFFFFFWAVVT